MLTSFASWTGILLELLLLFLGIRRKLLSKYPLFYAYIFTVLIVDVMLYAVYRTNPSAYRSVGWATQFLSLVVGYGVILEIVHNCLAAYAGAERFARALILAIFAIVFSYVAVRSWTSPNWSPAHSYGELERDLRTVQAIVLAGILGVVYHYGVPLGKNIRGIILGYGLYIATSIMNLEMRAYAGASFHQAWSLILPWSYFLSLLIWVKALWSFQPNPAPAREMILESDYESLATRTRGVLGAMRSYLERTARLD
jgi:ABC-type cobalt transport system substrate-binding protein